MEDRAEVLYYLDAGESEVWLVAIDFGSTIVKTFPCPWALPWQTHSPAGTKGYYDELYLCEIDRQAIGEK